MICVQFSQEGASTLHYRSRSLSFFFSLFSLGDDHRKRPKRKSRYDFPLCIHFFLFRHSNCPHGIRPEPKKSEKGFALYIRVQQAVAHVPMGDCTGGRHGEIRSIIMIHELASDKRSAGSSSSPSLGKTVGKSDRY